MINQLFNKILLQVFYKNCDNNTGLVKRTDLQDIFQIRRMQISCGEQTFNIYRNIVSEPRVKEEALIQAQGRAFYTWNNINLKELIK